MGRPDAGHERFDSFLGEPLTTAGDDPDIIGIVAMRSTAARHRVGGWVPTRTVR